MTNMSFETWRKELSKKQAVIDEIEEAFWSSHSNDEKTMEEFEKAEIEFRKKLQPLLLDLQAHAQLPVDGMPGE